MDIFNKEQDDDSVDNSLPNLFLTKHEIEILKLGLSFTPTPKYNISIDVPFS